MNLLLEKRGAPVVAGLSRPCFLSVSPLYAMASARDTEETTVLATYSTRRTAEMARDYLADADIRAFVSSDDAGGMHPQMQRPHGVKLVGMRATAQRARSLLDDAALLPEGDENRPEAPSETDSSEGWASAVYALALLLGALAGLLVLLMVLLG